MTKPEIVERLLSVEQAHAEVHQQLARLQFQLPEQEYRQVEEQWPERCGYKQKSGGENNNDSTRTAE